MHFLISPHSIASSRMKRFVIHCRLGASVVRAYTGIWLAMLLLVLAACGAGSALAQQKGVPSQTLVPTSSVLPTATALPAGTVLYQANWSHGLASLQGTHGWKVVQGQLETYASDPANLAIPYRPTVINYAIEIRLQVVRLFQKNGGYFTIGATKEAGKDGYQAGVNGLEGSESRPNGAHPQAQVLIDPYSSMAIGSAYPVDYEPGSQWHTFRVEVQGNEAILLVDGVQIGRASSEKTDVLSNGPLSLSSSLLDLRVSSLRIISL